MSLGTAETAEDEALEILSQYKKRLVGVYES